MRAADPFVAIGSVIKAGEPALYHWRYYLGRAAVGVAADMRSAENHLLMRHRDYLRAPEQAEDDAGASDRAAALKLRWQLTADSRPPGLAAQ